MSTYRAKERKGLGLIAGEMTTVADTSGQSLLADFGPDKAERFQKAILTFRHNLAGTGLFTDEALIELMEHHPTDRLDVCTMGGTDPRFPNRFMTGDFRDASGRTDGATLLEAAKSGRIWINVREAMNLHDEYRNALERIYGELAEATGNSAFNPRGGVLISSPIAKVPFHCDKTETILWHVRGAKRILIYPCTQDFIPDVSYEATLTSLIDDDLPYDEAMDAQATVFDLEPGQAVTWPLNSPHRVENRAFCVSVTTEYSTRASALKNSAMLANAVMRSRLGLNPSYERDHPAIRRTKSVLGRAMKKAGLVPDTSEPDMVRFRIDPDVDGYVVPTEPFVRDF